MGRRKEGRFFKVPPPPCKTICGHDLRRFHFSCLFCRIRRWYTGKMDKSKYVFIPPGRTATLRIRVSGLVVPKQCQVYVLFIDPNRRYRTIKQAFLKRLLTIAELLAN